MFATAAVGAVALVLLAIQLPADPATGVTASASPFTDEGWYLLGARNQALLGRFLTDDWQLSWAHLPFTVVAGGVFEIFGVGVVQGRALSVVFSVTAVAFVGRLLVRRLGMAAGLVGGFALSASALLLYYGRLGILEPMVMVLLAIGLVLLLSRATDRPVWRGMAVGVALALAIGTKPLATPAVTGIILGAAVAGYQVPGMRRRVIAAVVVIAVAGAAWAVVAIPQPGAVDSILRITAVGAPPESAMAVVGRAIEYLGESDGAISLAAPLFAGSLLGITLLAARWRSVGPHDRAMAGAAIGWFVFGMATLLVASYRPSRYVLPLLPAMAILTGFGVALALGLLRENLTAARRPAVVAAIVVALGIGTAAPGIGAVAGWTASATYRLPQIQAELLELMTDGHAVEGALGPTFAMRVPVPAIVVRPGLNDGDVYDTHGVRWLLDDPSVTPNWAKEHPDSWAAREVVGCYEWPIGDACLIRVP